MGTEENRKLVLNHLKTYQKEIKKKIEESKFFLITGNAIELFGASIEEENGKKIKCLNIFPFHAKEESFRMADEALLKCDFLNNYVLGFQNQGSVIKDNQTPMFEVLKGIGSYPKSKGEGIHYKNFYATYLLGPFLLLNPLFMKYLLGLSGYKKPLYLESQLMKTYENRLSFMETMEHKYIGPE